ncbi:lon-related putative ATP-dependent protease [Peptoclostridium litorale DSM 5388]|uniref:endopeptidase La n=1 Tax=Peptoclostridium litorale DSM 5388 TaxID=1121324 RepID=A0A069RCT9_PEPLI|nr:ATP-binding protein [Peptoclostridium litorale]KDR94836.1 peptidase S16 [Peptoclostridium litorale DSM 5388]SIN93751.1 lon-related putative ATP-dependent protease [Peptoclostridium litorale DSM 5388]
MVDLKKWELNKDELKYSCELEKYEFETTKDLEPLRGIIGQNRAAEALRFGLKMKKNGYNVYVAGLSGTGRTSYTKSLVQKVASTQKEKNIRDWVYVYNFNSADEPTALSFEAGVAKQFKRDVEVTIDKLMDEVPKIFSSREYEIRSAEIVQRYERISKNILIELNEFARTKGFIFQQTNQGLFSIPLKSDGTPMSDEEYKDLTEEDYETIRAKSSQVNKEINDYLNRIRALEGQFRESLEELDRRTGDSIASFFIEVLIEDYGKDEKVLSYLKEVKNDIIENIHKFKESKTQEQPNPLFMMQQKDDGRFFMRYQVNLFIDNSGREDLPIVNEINPTYYNLTGMIEYKNEMGAMTTNFMQLKPGALHKANGGFLILDVKDVFSHPFAWDALKRALRTNSITMETLNKQYGYIVTSTLKPDPIDLDLKVILIGDYRTYSILYAYDEEFRKQFRIMADFDVEFKRNEENVIKLARFIRSHCEEVGIKHFDKGAVEKVVEYSSRLADDKKKLSARFNQIVEILYEADAYSNDENEYVTATDVAKAIEGKRYRNSKYEEKLNELFEEGTLLIDIEGEKIGQINGLTVMGSGEYSFGKPARMTASTYKGKAGIINIEREVRHSGSIHDKGVLILSGYLGERYGKEKPISLATSITFEQTYSHIDGDSASSTELYVIISSIAQIPIKQYIAVTGSISQKGEIQPIGGVNEKIEGFFDVCKIKGLTGSHGVMIPKTNVKNLMIKDEIIDAVENGLFHIYAIENVSEGIEILTGLTMDEIDSRVRERLEKSSEDEDKKDKGDNEESKDNDKKDKNGGDKN